MIRVANTQRSVRIATKALTQRTQKALTLLKFSRAEVSLLLCGDRRMRSLNKQYRGIDRTTDVLSFPMLPVGVPPACMGNKDHLGPSQNLLGDIVISIPVACKQARQQGHSLKRELDQLMIHGLLHLLGYDHEKNAYQARKMRSKEKELLEALSAG